jgi:hypothetical protein
VPMGADMAVADFMVVTVVGTVADTADISCAKSKTRNEDHDGRW